MLIKREVLKNIAAEITTITESGDIQKLNAVELRAIMEEWASKIKNGNYKNDR